VTNLQVAYNLECRRGYERDGVYDANLNIRGSASRIQYFPDDLTLTLISPVNGSGTATVVSTRATKVFQILIDAAGSGGFLLLQNATSGVINTAQTLAMVIPFPANETVAIRVYPGSLSSGFFNTGIVCGTTTTVAGTTAIATAINKVMFLTSTAP
jgi:hypothetical protein